MLRENAHMKKRAARKTGRGGRALLTGMARCGHCGRIMRTFYSSGLNHAHRYQCRGDDAHVGAVLCTVIGGMAVDRTVSAQVLEAVSAHAVDAAILAAEQEAKATAEVRRGIEKELEEARYSATFAERRYELVDPAKRHVVRELEARWNAALERVAALERRLLGCDEEAAERPSIDRDALMSLTLDLPRAWNAPGTDARTRQRLVRLLVEEIVISLNDAAHEAVVVVHWIGGRYTTCRIPRRRAGGYPSVPQPDAVEVMRRLGGRWPDRDLAVTLNRMRCKTPDGET